MIGCPCGTIDVRPRKKTVGNFGNVAALRAFLDVFEIIQAEADDLARLADRQRIFESGKRLARGSRRALGNGGELFGVAVVFGEPFAEIARNFAVHGLQIDDLIALDNTEMRASCPSNATIFMLLSPSRDRKTPRERRDYIGLDCGNPPGRNCPAVSCCKKNARATAPAPLALRADRNR